MEGDNGGNNQGDPSEEKKVSVSGKLSVDFDSKAINDIATSIRQETTAQNQQETRANIISEGQRQEQIATNTIYRRANNISRTSNLINSLLCIATIGVFVLNKCAVDAAIRAANIAERAVKLDSLRAIKNSFDDSVKFQKQFDLADSSLGAQVNSIKETQKEFKIDNEPYIEISDLHLTIDENKPIYLAYNIYNLNRYPLKILEFREATMSWDSVPDYKKDFKMRAVNMLQNVNRYLIKEIPAFFYYNEPIPITKDRYDDIMSKRTFLYFYAYIVYKNLITGDKKSYEMAIKIINPSSTKIIGLQYLINRNTKLPR